MKQHSSTPANEPVLVSPSVMAEHLKQSSIVAAGGLVYQEWTKKHPRKEDQDQAVQQILRNNSVTLAEVTAYLSSNGLHKPN